jgi:branched-chain amino acid transport system ATP-binding protein
VWWRPIWDPLMLMLEVDNIEASYSEVKVLHGVSFTVEAGEIVSILGSNGAGKSTALRAVAGLMHPTKGSVRFQGSDIGGWPAHKVARGGLTLVPEGRQLFPQHTVRENLELGAYKLLMAGKKSGFGEALAEIFELFPRVRERINQPAGQLSGGEQQMVAIARALVSRPKMLLLDEPSLGLAPLLVRSIFEAFQKLREQGLTILIVEQMAWLALEICDRAYVLENGKIILTGTGAEMARNPRVMEAYLGGETTGLKA